MAENLKKRKVRQTSSDSDIITNKKRDIGIQPKYRELTSESEESDSDRNRTPSGSVLPKKVGDIRTFFLTKARKLSGDKAKAELYRDQSTVNEGELSGKISQLEQRSVKRRTRSKQTVQPKHQSADSVKTNIQADNEEDTDQTEQSESCDNRSSVSTDSEQENNFLYTLAGQLKFATSEEMLSSNESNTYKSAMQSVEESVDRHMSTLENAEMNLDNEENPRVIQVSAVVQMFQEIKQELKNAAKTTDVVLSKEQWSQLKQECINEITESLGKNIDIEMQKYQKIGITAENTKKKTKILTDVCDRMDTQIKDIDQRIENLELNNNKKMLVVSGLRAVEKKNMIEYMNGFFDLTLGVKVEVDDCFLVGMQVPKQIVVTCKTIQDKKLILSNKSSLKGVKDEGNNIYINDYIPAVIQERRRRHNHVSETATAIFGEEKVGYIKGQVVINGQPYRKKVLPPTPSELINTDPKLLESLFKKTTAKGREVTKEGSAFLAYTAAVKDHQDVRNLYTKVKLLQPAAKHVVCAYWVDHPEEYYALDYHDDGEHAVGRLIMELLKVNNLKNRVFLVARRYGGSKLGSDRFQCYLEACISALRKHEHNDVLDVRQEIVVEDPRKKKKTPINNSNNWADLDRVDEQDEDETQNAHSNTPLPHRYYHSAYKYPSRPNRSRGGRPQNRPTRGAVSSTQRQANYFEHQKKGELVPKFPHMNFNFSTPWNAEGN